MPSLNTRKTNPTGGWWWHARAWRSQTDWQGVAQSLRDECLRSSPQADRLVIIGASAGWMLSSDWLSRFRQLETHDIDPWAWRLFNWRHGRTLRQAGVTVTHHVGDAWSRESTWLRRDVHTVYWFDNVLGQLRFLQPLESTRHQINQLKKRLKGVAWGSLHDRYSGPLSGSHEAPPDWRSTAGVDLHDPLAQPWLHRWGAKGDWLDHLTEGVFRPGTPVLNLAWPFKPGFGHWLEMGWQLP